MATCDSCNKRKATTQLGRYLLCKKCHIRIFNHFMESKAEDVADLKLKPKTDLEIKRKINGTYGIKESCINICVPMSAEYDTEDKQWNKALTVIHHENLHHVIHKIAGIQACYNMDRMAYFIARELWYIGALGI